MTGGFGGAGDVARAGTGGNEREAYARYSISSAVNVISIDLLFSSKCFRREVPGIGRRRSL